MEQSGESRGNNGSNGSSGSGAYPDGGVGGNPVTRGVDNAGAALHSGIDKMADPARSAIDRASTAAHHTVDHLADSASQAAEKFSEKTRYVTDAPSRALDYSVSCVREKPLQAVGAALAIGFILGRLTGR